MSKVVLLELVEEFESFRDYIAANGLDQSEFKIIAIDFRLQAHLKRAGVRHSDTLPYIGSDSFKRLLLKGEELLDHIDANFSFTDGRGVKTAYVAELRHYVELQFNYIGKIIEILRGVFEEDPRAEIYAPAAERIDSSAFVFNDRLLGVISSRYASAQGSKCRLFGARQTRGVTRGGSLKGGGPVYRLLIKLLGAYFRATSRKPVALASRTHGFEKLCAGMLCIDGKVVFVMLNDKRDSKRHIKYGGVLAGLLSGYFYVDIASAPGRESPGEREDIARRVGSALERAPLEYLGVDFSDLVIAKSEAAYAGHLGDLAALSAKLRRLFDELGVRFIMSPHGRGVWYVAAELAGGIGVPSLFVSHGTHPAPTDRFHEAAIFNMCRGFMLGSFSHVAVSTPVQEAHLRYFKSKSPRIRNEEVKSGPLTFAEITKAGRDEARRRLGYGEDDFVAVHAVSLKYKGGERFHFLETVDEYLSALRDVVAAVNAIDKTRLIVRLHPGFEYMRDDIGLFLPESGKYTVSCDGVFQDVLAAADLLVSYSSTTIDEALLNRIPVLLYDKWARYNHFNTGVFESPASRDVFPVCYVNSADKLVEAMRFMAATARAADKATLDVSRYRYTKDYSADFYGFVASSLNRKERGEDAYRRIDTRQARN